MASIYRRSRSYPIPAGAEITERNRKATRAELQRDSTNKTIVEQVVKWTDGKGRQRRGVLNTDGTRVMVESGSYLISYWDAAGKRQVINSQTADRDAAEQIARKLEADVALRKRGIIDTAQERLAREMRRPIVEHVADYRATMEAAGRGTGHVNKTIGFIERIIEATDAETVGDIAVTAVASYAVALQSQGKSARTVQAVLTAAKSFTRWLTRHGKLPTDPLASLAKPSPKLDRRRERRMLLPEEWDWLRTTTASGPQRYNMTGHERMLVYATAIQTGLRASELDSLTRGCLYLDQDQPYITVRAHNTKNKQDARLYVQRELADLLKKHIATKAPGAKVFAMPSISNVARMLRADLADSRRGWLKEAQGPEDRTRRNESDFLMETNHEGEQLDFHALRHTCGAWLAKSGVHPKVVQTVMRHSAITLTMDTYGHLFPGHEADAVGKLPEMFGQQQPVLQATATDGKGLASFSLPANRQQLRGEDGPRSARRGEKVPAADLPTCERNVRRERSLGDARREQARSGESRPGRIRTSDQGIMSPLL